MSPANAPCDKSSEEMSQLIEQLGEDVSRLAI